MLLKILVVVLFIGVLISLSSGLVFLLKDIENPRKRLLYALGIRVSLAAAMILTIMYGIYTGQFTSKAPWDRQLHPERVAPNSSPQTPINNK